VAAARPGEEISGGRGGSTLHVPCGGDWMQNGLVPDNPTLTLRPAGRQLSHTAWEAGGVVGGGAFLERPGWVWWRSADRWPNGGAGDALRSCLG
jgi:hypothetical protein